MIESRDPLPPQIERYLQWLAVQQNSPKATVLSYRGNLAKLTILLGADAATEDVCSLITPESLDKAQVALADILPRPRSRALCLMVWGRFIWFAALKGWMDEKIKEHITIPKFTPGDPHPMPTEDVEPLLAALPKENLRDLRDRALVHFLLATGCRISEAMSVNKDEVRADGFRVLGSKARKHRTVYLTDAAAKAIDDYLMLRGPDDSPALFISVRNQDRPKGKTAKTNRLSADGARQVWEALRRRSIGTELYPLFVKLKSPHAARHTAATTLLEASGGDARFVQEILGHATMETLKVYTEITNTRKRLIYSKLEGYLHERAKPGGN